MSNTDLTEFIFIPLSDFIFKAIGERPYLMNSAFNGKDGDYIACKIVEIPIISWSEGARTNSGTDGRDVVYTTYEAIVRIVAYGDSALTKIQSICQAFREKRLLKILQEKNIAYSTHNPARDTSFQYLDKVEIRYETLCTLRFVQGGIDRGDDPSYIEKAGATATYT